MKKYIKNQLMTRDKRLYYDFLPPMIEIIEKPANMLVNVIMYTCFVLILTAIIWACFARLDISVTAYGSVKSEEAIDSMISLVSGTIENVNYKEGDYLKKGDVLCTLVSDANDSAVEQYRYKLETLRIQKELYEKLYEKYENNDYSSLEADITAYGDNSVPATEIILENEVFLQNLAISGADNEAYLKNNQRLNVVKKINEINEETKNVTTQLESSEQNLRNTRITAAQSGYLTMNGELYPGKTVSAGETIGYISDSKGNYYFSAYVSDADIEALKTGDEVKLKINAYNDTEYEIVSGVIYNISDVPVNDEKGGALYKTEIKIEELPDNLKTGMRGNADIVVGTRTVMDYFLEPFKNCLGDSLKEK